MNCTPIVVLAMSAGGLPPLKIFFDHALRDRCAYFILNHLPYDYHSRLNEILAKHSKLAVIQAEQGMFIKPNTIFTAPPKHYMSVSHDKLRLNKRDVQSLQNESISIFLQSLIADDANNVIVVFLSGAGKDGTQLIHAIKKIGGKIIAQTPGTCEFASLSENAIATNLVDYTAAPADIPAIIHSCILPVI